MYLFQWFLQLVVDLVNIVEAVNLKGVLVIVLAVFSDVGQLIILCSEGRFVQIGV